MNLKYLLIGAVLGGLASFVWGAVYHAGIGIDMKIMTEFKDAPAVATFVRDHTGGNGVYYSHQGVIAAVSMTPDMADKSKMSMTPQLVKQYVINAVAAGLLAWLLLFTGVRSSLGAAGLFALAGLAAGVASDLSAWNWYGRPMDFTLAMMVDQVVCFFVAGLVVGWARRKFAPAV